MATSAPGISIPDTIAPTANRVPGMTATIVELRTETRATTVAVRPFSGRAEPRPSHSPPPRARFAYAPSREHEVRAATVDTMADAVRRTMEPGTD